MSINVTDKRFESDIETFFLSPKGGYTKHASADLDKKKGLFFNTFIQFLPLCLSELSESSS